MGCKYCGPLCYPADLYDSAKPLNKFGFCPGCWEHRNQAMYTHLRDLLDKISTVERLVDQCPGQWSAELVAFRNDLEFSKGSPYWSGVLSEAWYVGYPEARHPWEPVDE